MKMKKAGAAPAFAAGGAARLSRLILGRGFLVFLLRRKCEGEQRDGEPIHELSFLDGAKNAKRWQE
jgi:hypothetical protein